MEQQQQQEKMSFFSAETKQNKFANISSKNRNIVF